MIKSNDSSNKILKEVGPYLNLGYQIAITICLMTALGWWLDKTLDTKPYFIVGLSIFGVVAALVTFLRSVMNLQKKK